MVLHSCAAGVGQVNPCHEVVIPVQLRYASMTEAVVRRAEGADLAAIAWLRRQWTQEQDGDLADPGFDERLSAWVRAGVVTPDDLAG